MRRNGVTKHNLVRELENTTNFCCGPLANKSQCQHLPNKHPGLAAMFKIG